MKKVIGFLQGLAIGFVIAALLILPVYFFRPKPKPVPVKVDGDGFIAGKVDLKKAGKFQTKEVIKYVYIPVPGKEAQKSNLSLGEYRFPATGEVKLKFADPSGRNLGEGVVKLSGETSVKLAEDSLEVRTDFKPEGTVTFNLPKEKEWAVYGGVKMDFREVGTMIGAEWERKIKGDWFGRVSGEVWKVEDDLKGEVKAVAGWRF